MLVCEELLTALLDSAALSFLLLVNHLLECSGTMVMDTLSALQTQHAPYSFKHWVFLKETPDTTFENPQHG